jgi:hypothetical protein
VPAANLLAFEIPVDHRQDQTLQTRSTRAGLRVTRRYILARVPGFGVTVRADGLAIRRATVAVDSIAIITGLVRAPVPVATYIGTSTALSSAVVADGFLRTGLGATSPVTIEQAIVSALVTFLVGVLNTIAAN